MSVYLVTHNGAMLEVALLSKQDIPLACLQDAKRDRFRVVQPRRWIKPFDASDYSQVRAEGHWLERYGYHLHSAVGFYARQSLPDQMGIEITTKDLQHAGFRIRVFTQNRQADLERFAIEILDGDRFVLQFQSHDFLSMAEAEYAALTWIDQQK